MAGFISAVSLFRQTNSQAVSQAEGKLSNMLRNVLVAFALFSFCFIQPVIAVELKIKGSTTVSYNLLIPGKDKIEKETGVELNIIPNGSIRGVEDLINGEADMALISLPFDLAFSRIDDEMSGRVNISEFKPYQVGYSDVAFVVHPLNPVKKLTPDNVTDILCGKITNWSEISRMDHEIIIFCEDNKGGIRNMVESVLLEGKCGIKGNKRELPSGAQIPSIISQLPSSFGVMSAGLVNDSIVQVNTDWTISQPLSVVTKGEPTPEMEAVINAMKHLDK